MHRYKDVTYQGNQDAYMEVSGRTTQEIKSSNCRGANICPYILTMRRSLPSMAPRHTVHPVHKKAGDAGLVDYFFYWIF